MRSSWIMASLLRHAGFFENVVPLGDVGLKVTGELFRLAADRRRADRGERLYDFRLLQRTGRFRRDLRDDLAGGARRREQPVPGTGVESSQACLRRRRYLGEKW